MLDENVSWFNRVFSFKFFFIYACACDTSENQAKNKHADCSNREAKLLTWRKQALGTSSTFCFVFLWAYCVICVCSILEKVACSGD